MVANIDELLDLKNRYQQLGKEYEAAERDYRTLLIKTIADTALSREQRMIYVEWLHDLKLEKDD